MCVCVCVVIEQQLELGSMIVSVPVSHWFLPTKRWVHVCERERGLPLTEGYLSDRGCSVV